MAETSYKQKRGTFLVSEELAILYNYVKMIHKEMVNEKV